MSAFKRGHKFTSRQQGLQKRVRTYVCEDCGLWHRIGKPIECAGCGCKAFLNFDSTKEAKRWAQLHFLQSQGEISQLRRQVRFPLYFDGRVITKDKLGKPIMTYIADFTYIDRGEFMVEDVKPKDDRGTTDVFKLKRRLIEPVYGFEIKLTK